MLKFILQDCNSVKNSMLIWLYKYFQTSECCVPKLHSHMDCVYILASMCSFGYSTILFTLFQMSQRCLFLCFFVSVSMHGIMIWLHHSTSTSDIFFSNKSAIEKLNTAALYFSFTCIRLVSGDNEMKGQ